MKKVLMYGNRKEYPTFWDISTPELSRAGFLALFKHLDKVWECYQFSDDDAPTLVMDPSVAASKDPDRIAERERLTKRWAKEKADFDHQRALYEKAKAGDARAAVTLLEERNDYEYEEWSTYTVEEPR